MERTNPLLKMESSKRTAARPLTQRSTSQRSIYTAALGQTPGMKAKDPAFFHGRLYKNETNAPQTSPAVAWRSAQQPRKKYDVPSWLTASEFKDQAHVLEAKCTLLATMLRCSRKTVVYTGAGISVASGIGQAAAGSKKSKKGFRGAAAATPSYTHRALVALESAGLIDSWVQQNHDGLPQKAGFPQHKINEVHGSWFDPSNPVVKYTGSLKTTEYDWLEHDTETADLVLVLGTSLSGLCADDLVESTATRSKHGRALGTVIINLQQTRLDGGASLRVFEQSDATMKCLATKLGVTVPARAASWEVQPSRVAVPYGKGGQRSTCGAKMWLNLAVGQQVKLSAGHNIQSAHQPQFMHIGAKKPYTHRGRTRQPGKGVGTVIAFEPSTASVILRIDGAQMRLGVWWLEAARLGGPHELPLTNLHPLAVTPGSEKAAAAAATSTATATAAAAAAKTTASKGRKEKGETRARQAPLNQRTATPKTSSSRTRGTTKLPGIPATVSLASHARTVADDYTALA